jgi:hypothetical protein
VLRRGAKYYYFAYAEDHSRTVIEFEGRKDALKRRVHRPVFEIIFVFDPEHNSLSTYYDGRLSTVRELQEIFAREILLTHLPNLERDQRIYELNHLKNRLFHFIYPPNSNIADVRIRQLKFSLMGGGSRRLTLEANPYEARGAVYGLMDIVLNTNGSQKSSERIPLSLVNIVRAGITVQYLPDGKGRARIKNFTISCPNSCTLKHEDRDEVLRQMLIDSGIGPCISLQETAL